MDNIRFYLFGNCCEKLTEGTVYNERVCFLCVIYTETIDRSVFGGVFVNNRFYTFPDFRHTFYVLGKKIDSVALEFLKICLCCFYIF